MLYIFEDNEAVIKMVIKGRSPMMRHVSRTHRVALGWLFDRINLDSKIQIKYIDTKNQLADTLTKGSFTHDEWSHLLRLFNIMRFSMFSCSLFSTINNSKTISKRQMQEEIPAEEARVVARSKPMMSLVPKTANRSPTALGSSASDSLGTLGAQSSSSDRTSMLKPVAEGLNENTASSSQVWHSDANTITTNKTIDTKLFHHNFQISNVDHLKKVYSNVRLKLSRPQGDEMLDIDVNAMISGIFASATVKAAVHLGQDYQENLRTTKNNTDFKKVQTLFDISQKLIPNQKDEIFRISTIEWNSIPWMRTTLLHDKAIKLSKAKVHVYSVLVRFMNILSQENTGKERLNGS